MPSVPQNPYVPTDNVRKAPAYQVRLGATNPLTPSDEVDHLRPIEVSIKAGGGIADTCTLQWDQGLYGDRVVDFNVPTDWTQFIEVWMPNDDGEVTTEAGENVGTLLFWGELAQQGLGVKSGDGEYINLLATVQPHHFGGILYNAKHWQSDVSYYEPDIEFVFNPEIDGKIEPNCGATQIENDNGLTTYRFVHPESVRTTAARELNNESAAPESWTMQRAVAYLLNDLNGAENFIDNPSMAHIEEIFGTGAPTLRDIRIPRGEYLPKCLDTLLHQHGYGWTLVPTRKDDSSNRVQLRFFKYGEGTQRPVYLQKPGEALDLSKSNCLDADTTFNIADIANRIVVQGEFKELELTVELYRAWAEADDSLDAFDLQKGNPESQYETDPTKRNVWRKWVLNEAGDYNGLRTSVKPITDAFDFSGYSAFGSETVPRRRKFLDCLAYEPNDKIRRDPYVEWWNPDDSAWQPLPHTGNFGYHILQKECGIYFSSEQPPQSLIDAGANARIRVTATIRSDVRLTGTAARQSTSPNANEITLFIDMRHQFAYRAVHSGSSLLGNANGADTKDDSSLITAFAESCRNQEDAARLSAAFVLHGIRHEYQIGNVIHKIDGRNIELNRNNPSQSDKRYLQIVGITHRLQDQQTVLDVDTLELKKSQLDTGAVY